MGRKSNRKIENQINRVIVLVIILLVLAVASKNGILENIEKDLTQIGILETVGEVKQDQEVDTKISENIVLDKNKLNILL